jgi:prepilin-type N-terminal cleavage/methylation domain-containing protein/prepilin-type processing-associated H-X9-DG protein
MKRHPNRPAAGFTLTELLVVIVIIAVLAAIIMPAFGAIRRKGDQTKCLANLRQIGAGMGSYIGDHDGYLPGPLWTLQTCWYDEEDFGTLATVLAPYLGLIADSEKKRADMFVCPSWQKGGPYLEDDLFIMNSAVLVDGQPVNPWGDANVLDSQGEPSADPNAVDRAKKLLSLADANMAQTWAMQDVDMQSSFAKLPSGIAKTPVHGEVCNALFFDFHVAPIPVKPKP